MLPLFSQVSGRLSSEEAVISQNCGKFMVSYRCGDVASELFVDRLDFLGTKKIIASPLIFPRVLLKPRGYFFGIRTPTRNCCSIEYYFLVCTQKVVKHFNYIDRKKTFTYNLKFVFKDEA